MAHDFEFKMSLDPYGLHGPIKPNHEKIMKTQQKQRSLWSTKPNTH